MTSTDLKDTPDSDESKPGDGVHQHNPAAPADKRPKEIGGRKGPDPTRYGDWEKNGRCIDF